MATSDKYDRQLRLWGSHGQRALSSASILLVGADSAGTEALKNLVLPGVGSFTIVDSAVVSDNDVGSNFFVHQADKGRPRAEVTCGYLKEMNSDVEGAAILSDPSLLPWADMVPQFTVVVVSNAPRAICKALAKYCWDAHVPMVVITSAAQIGSYRVQLRSHAIVETRVDVSTRGLDLRIAKPFPELARFCAQFDLDTSDPMSRGNVPYIAILYQCIQQWRVQHGADPRTFADKAGFKAMVRARSRDIDNELNFAEAVDKAYQVSSSALDMCGLSLAAGVRLGAHVRRGPGGHPHSQERATLPQHWRVLPASAGAGAVSRQERRASSAWPGARYDLHH
jgi:amyloid beta precursor protein binding protein 1